MRPACQIIWQAGLIALAPHRSEVNAESRGMPSEQPAARGNGLAIVAHLANDPERLDDNEDYGIHRRAAAFSHSALSSEHTGHQ